MKRIIVKYVPKLLDFQQKRYRIAFAERMLAEVSDDPHVLKRVITGDEMWLYAYDIETIHSEEPRPKRARKVRLNVKVLMMAFFDYNGLIYCEFLLPNDIKNKRYYLEVLTNLREAIRRKRPELRTESAWILHHDSARTHIALCIERFFAEHKIVVMPQPTHSPDLAPCDFFLFPKVKSILKGQNFSSIDKVKVKLQIELKKIPKGAFTQCFADWQQRWRKCVISKGGYFEGNEINKQD